MKPQLNIIKSFILKQWKKIVPNKKDPPIDPIKTISHILNGLAEEDQKKKLKSNEKNIS